MAVTYVDFRVAPVEGAEYISEFTWINEGPEGLSALQCRHYFVDYPGAKELERLVIDAVGGKPFVRYSCPTVLKAFLDDVPEGYIVAFRTAKQKQLVSALLSLNDVTITRTFCVFDDIDAGYGEVEAIMHTIERTRTKASQQFGNAV